MENMEVAEGVLFGFLGNGAWASAVYALWDSTFSVGICLGLIALFHRYLDHSTRFSRFLSRQAFSVYVIHASVIVALAVLLRDIHPEQLLKFRMAAIIGVPLCFGVAYLFRKIPLLSRVL
jgi:glucans biosynthesis protein C